MNVKITFVVVHGSWHCNFFHLFSGWMVTMGVSKDFPDICPEQSGFVRAKLLGGGYVFKPVPGGTLATIVVQVSSHRKG